MDKLKPCPFYDAIASELDSVYTVRACRWGDSETHSYIIGVFLTQGEAEKAAQNERDWRGGKYDCEILKWIVGKTFGGKYSYRPEIIKSI